MADLTRTCNNFQKKTICVLAAPIKEGTENEQVPAVSDNHLLAILPPDAIIDSAYIFVKGASDAATSAVATIGTTSGGSEILSAADLATPGDTGTFTGKSDTGTGKEVWLGLTYTGAATNVGEYEVVVKYIEYTKNTGEYTKFN